MSRVQGYRMVIPRKGGPDVFREEAFVVPEPGPGEILVEVRAAGVNFADVLARKGLYRGAPPFPLTVGYEVAGEVIAVGRPSSGSLGASPAGPGNPGLLPGDRVMTLTRFGGYATHVCVSAAQCFAIPRGQSYTDAAALLVQYLTAGLATEYLGNIQQGDRVLVHNAGGGVGIAAAQLVRARAGYLAGTASSWKHPTLRALGYDALIDYRSTDINAALRELPLEPPGFDLILNPLGGKELARDLKRLRPAGRVMAYGVSGRARGGQGGLLGLLRTVLQMPRVHPVALMGGTNAIGGLNLANLWTELNRFRPYARTIVERFGAGTLAPLVHAIYPLRRAGDAQAVLEDRKNIGKVILAPEPA